MNQNFYEELSYYCSPYIYKNLDYGMQNKQKYLDTIFHSSYKYHLIPHLPLEDFMYVFNQLDENDIMIIFRTLCIHGYEKKIKFVCYSIEFINSNGFDIEMIKYVIPHHNKDLIYFLIEYFQCYQFPDFNEIFHDICVYNHLCLDVFISQLIQLNDLEIYNYIKQAINRNRFKIFAYLIDLFKLDLDERKHKPLTTYLIDITSLCIEKNKMKYVEYIHKINPLNAFFSGLNCVNKIKSFQMYEYLRVRVSKKDIFDRRFLYAMIKRKNKEFVKRCVKLSPYSICQYNHKAIHISTGNINQFLTDIHPCGKEINEIEQNTIDQITNTISLFTSNLHRFD